MKFWIYKIYKNGISQVLFFLFILITRLPKGRFVASSGLEKIWDITLTRKVNNKLLSFHTPNWLAFYRAQSLLTKEPETIAWLNQISKNSVIYDIGSNIGTYSIYAAAVRDCKVLSFEPSFYNLELLFRNVQSNNLEDKVTIIPLSLSNIDQIENFYMQSGDNIWGGAHNSSGSNLSQDGLPMQNFKVSSQLAISLDTLVNVFNLPHPDHIKIDVDGLEFKILQGAIKMLGKSKSILVENDERNRLQNDGIQELLSNHNFVKLHSISNIKLNENQIWVKPGWDT